MKYTLIAVTGLTPQVITETLYYLTQVRRPPVSISEIYVITTLDGRDKIIKNLLNGGKGKYYEFLKEYNINPESILFDSDCIMVARDSRGNMLRDMRTSSESREFSDYIMQIMKRKTMSDDKAIIASVAGGRKTMSVYLAYAMQVFGRSRDMLTHVLVNEEFENHPDFYYIPKKPKNLKTVNGKTINTRDAKIELAEIPFIRLREKLPALFGEEEMNYNKMVEISQNEIDLIQPILLITVNLHDRKVQIGDKVFALSPILFSIYVYMAQLKTVHCIYPERKNCADCNGCYKSLNEITETENLSNILSCYKKMYRPESIYYEKLKERFGTFRADIIDSFRQYFSKINREIDKTLAENSEYYKIISVGTYGAKKYGLKIDKSKIIIRE